VFIVLPTELHSAPQGVEVHVLNAADVGDLIDENADGEGLADDVANRMP
jgi:hypothetical protein